MIRRAVDGDEAAVARIMSESVSPVWTSEQIRSVFSSPDADIYVCDEDGVVGYAIAENVLDECCISSIAVSASFRGRGIGKALMLACMSGDAASYYLEVNERNVPAIALYKSCGFETAGVRRGYYGDASALIMTRRSA